MQRCKAKSKRSGNQCKNHAIKSWGVCRMHGAKGGPKTVEGWMRCKKASLKHGFYSSEEQIIRKKCRKAINASIAQLADSSSI